MATAWGADGPRDPADSASGSVAGQDTLPLREVRHDLLGGRRQKRNHFIDPMDGGRLVPVKGHSNAWRLRQGLLPLGSVRRVKCPREAIRLAKRAASMSPLGLLSILTSSSPSMSPSSRWLSDCRVRRRDARRMMPYVESPLVGVVTMPARPLGSGDGDVHLQAHRGAHDRQSGVRATSVPPRRTAFRLSRWSSPTGRICSGPRPMCSP